MRTDSDYKIWLAAGMATELPCGFWLTWMLAVHNVVRLETFAGVAPGGFKASIACKPAPSSATGDDIVYEECETVKCSKVPDELG